MAKTRWKRKNF